MPNKPTKRVLSAKARKAISEAQKARWAKAKNKLINQVQEAQVERILPLTYYKAYQFLIERCRSYNSVMEAYVDGYLDGFNDR